MKQWGSGHLQVLNGSPAGKNWAELRVAGKELIASERMKAHGREHETSSELHAWHASLQRHAGDPREHTHMHGHSHLINTEMRPCVPVEYCVCVCAADTSERNWAELRTSTSLWIFNAVFFVQWILCFVMWNNEREIDGSALAEITSLNKSH